MTNITTSPHITEHHHSPGTPHLDPSTFVPCPLYSPTETSTTNKSNETCKTRTFFLVKDIILDRHYFLQRLRWECFHCLQSEPSTEVSERTDGPICDCFLKSCWRDPWTSLTISSVFWHKDFLTFLIDRMWRYWLPSLAPNLKLLRTISLGFKDCPFRS